MSADSIIPGQEDKAGTANPQNLNRYTYVTNNPVRYTDPTGHCVEVLSCTIEGAAAGSVLAPGVGTVVGGVVGFVAAVGVGAGIAYLATHGSYTTDAAGAVIPVVDPAESDSELPEAETDTQQTDENTNPYAGPVDKPVIVVDPKGNAIPVNEGEQLTGSPDGRFVQVRDKNGKPTGVRLDGPHKPATHSDPRAQEPHAHVPGVTNPDGTPWLPVKGPR